MNDVKKWMGESQAAKEGRDMAATILLDQAHNGPFLSLGNHLLVLKDREMGPGGERVGEFQEYVRADKYEELRTLAAAALDHIDNPDETTLQNVWSNPVDRLREFLGAK